LSVPFSKLTYFLEQPSAMARSICSLGTARAASCAANARSAAVNLHRMQGPLREKSLDLSQKPRLSEILRM